MIEINLVPEELLRKRRAFKMPDITLAFMPMLIGIIGFVILMHLVLVLTLKIKTSSYERMTKEWEELKPQKKSVELAREKKAETKNKVNAIESLMARNILWSKKLNQLSDLIVPGIWFTSISIDRKVVIVEPSKAPQAGIKRFASERTYIPYLKIKGEVSSLYGEELAIIATFINELKNDNDFFSNFSNIELGSTELHSIGEIEVTAFNINCYFKEPEAVEAR